MNAGYSIFEYSKYSQGARDYYSLSKEFIFLKESSLEILKREIKRAIKVIFSLNAPSAKEVYLVGDFNDWQPKDEFRMRNINGLWKKELYLKPGRYSYRFIVDGRWQEDPKNPNVIPNPFGEFNSFIEIKNK